VVGVLALLVAALVATDVITSSALRSFLVGRLDEQLDVAQAQAYRYIVTTYARDQSADPSQVRDPATWLATLATSPPVSTDPETGLATTPTGKGPRLNAAILGARLSPDIYVEVLDASGTVVFDDPSGLVSANDHDPAPQLPADLPVERQPPPHSFGQGHGPYVPDRPSFEVRAVGSSGLRYRAQAVAVPGGTLVTAVALAPTQATLNSLTHDELIVTGVVVLALVLLVLWIVRLGLRPLEDMTATAGAIAAGDLTRRVRRSDEDSEVGRLGQALNGMLSQIQAAFDERSRSEARLRRFIADASHELRTPLTSIRGYAELLRKGALRDEGGRRRAAERIEHESERMGVLVDDLLLLARLDQGRPVGREPVELGALVAEAVESARAVDRERHISLARAGDVNVLGDAARLRQVVDNLLRNALVHTPAGTAVHASVQRQGTRAVITVADEGPGLDPEQRTRVFDRFYQGSEARTGSGSGLGLSIVAALAHAHGGRAFAEASPSGGASFVVELPLNMRAGSQGQAAAETRQEDAAPAAADAGATDTAAAGEMAGADGGRRAEGDGAILRPLRR